MVKNKLETFIRKYSLGSIVEQARIVSDGKNLTTSFITEDRILLGKITGKGFDLDKFEIGIANTDRLKSLLSVLSDDIEFNLIAEDDVNVSVSLSDKQTQVVMMLADLSVVKVATSLKAIPDFDVVIPMSKEFISKFIKAKASLPEVETYTLIKDKKGNLNFVLGYTPNINSTCITLNISPEDGKNTLDKSYSFSAKHLKEVLSANSDVEESKLYVSNKGLAKLELNTAEFEATYFFLEKNIS